MSVTPLLKIGDTRERIVKVGWFGRTFYRDGRAYFVRNERLRIVERYARTGPNSAGRSWFVTEWEVLL